MLSECGVVACVVRQHDIEHFFHAAFGYADFFRTFDDVQIPESCHQSSFYSRLKKEVHTAVIVDIIVMRIVFWMIKLKITVAAGVAAVETLSCGQRLLVEVKQSDTVLFWNGYYFRINRFTTFYSKSLKTSINLSI